MWKRKQEQLFLKSSEIFNKINFRSLGPLMKNECFQASEKYQWVTSTGKVAAGGSFVPKTLVWGKLKGHALKIDG